MQLAGSIVISSLFSALALAAPPKDCRAVNLGAQDIVSTPNCGNIWTFEGMKRTCDCCGRKCHWSFTINTHEGEHALTPCEFITSASEGKPASQSPQTGVMCGDFRVMTGWSGQFGPGNGFTTLSVLRIWSREIAYPAYEDKTLGNGTVVTPDVRSKVEPVVL